jgi:hypothetical protein
LPGIFSYLHNIENRQVASNEDAFQQSSATVVRLAFGFAQTSGQGRYTESDLEWPGCDVDRFVPLEIIGVLRVVFVATPAQELAAHGLAAALYNVGKLPAMDVDEAKNLWRELANCLTISHFSRRARGNGKNPG